MQLVFVGAAGKTTQLERRALAFKGLQLRPHVLYNHLALRKILGGLDDVPLPTVADIAGWLASWADQVAARARWVVDDSVEEASKPSDVANVRDVAMDDEHAAELTAGVVGTDAAEDADSSLSLDPVGVFLQSFEVVAGGIFFGMRGLLQSEMHRATPEQPVDEPSELGQGEEDLHGRAANSDTQCRRCARESQPINEYTHNAELIYGAFWYLFPLRNGLQRCVPIATADSRHMFTQFHNLFAQKHNFLFLMANQV